MVEVTLTRGKRATFRDEASPLHQQGITTKAISVMVCVLFVRACPSCVYVFTLCVCVCVCVCESSVCGSGC